MNLKLSNRTTKIIIVVLFLIWVALIVRGIIIRPKEEGLLSIMEMNLWN